MALGADEQARLVALLRRLAAEGGAMPTTPRPIWDALAGVVPRLAVELCLTRPTHEDAIWLSYRDDESWRGWHIPGGFVGAGESLADACRRIGARELGVELELGAVVGDFAWPDHPCGAVLSLLCAVRSEVEPGADRGRWFEALPNDMVSHHAEFVAHFRRARALDDLPRRPSW
jgi:ADP-ribose pyrophosphatase YjhB (NUDIX family)